MAAQEVFNNPDLKEYILSFLFSKNYIFKNDKLEIILHHVKNIEFLLLDEIVNEAAEYGALNIVRWFYKNMNIYGTEEIIENAICSKNIKLIDFLLINSWEGCTPYTLITAVDSNNLSIVEVIISKFSNLFFKDIWEKAMIQAISNKNILILSYLFRIYIDKFKIDKLDDKFSIAAISTDDTNIINWVLERNNKSDKNELNIAAKNNNLFILNWLYENRIYENTLIPIDNENNLFIQINFQPKTLYYGVASNNIQIVKLIIKKEFNKFNKKIIKDSLILSCRKGNIEIFKFLIKQFNICEKIITKYCLPNAVSCNNFNILNYIYDNFHFGKYVTSFESFKICSDRSNVKMFDWLYSKGYSGYDNIKIINQCIKNWDLNFLSFFYNNIYISFYKNNNLYFTPEIISKSCLSGNRDIFNWFIDKNMYPCEKCFANSCISQNLNLIKIIILKIKVNILPNEIAIHLLENAFPENDNFEIIKFLYNNNLLILNKNSIDFATKSGNFKLIHWLWNNNFNENSIISIMNTIENGNYKIFKFLFERINEQNIHLNNDVINKAALEGQISILKLILKNSKYHNLVTNSALMSAFQNYNFSIIAFLQNFLSND